MTKDKYDENVKLDEEACIYAETAEPEDVLLDEWDLVECVKCGMPVSLTVALFDENENPYHENC